MKIRPERDGDAEAVYAIVEAAFGRPDEARLVDRLRAVAPRISLVASLGDELVGHVLFTPVTVEGRAFDPPAMGLAPLAVLPAHQETGAGSALSRAGLDACRALGSPFAVVLGHREYYPRFGFEPAAAHGLYYGARVANDSFMAQALAPGGLDGVEGLVRYDPAFDG